MAAVLKHWRESATLVLATSKVSQGVGLNLNLTRATLDTASQVSAATNTIKGDHNILNESTKEDNYEVLMMKRSSKSKFMPNVFVFPGGVAENSDFSNQWLSVFKKLGCRNKEQLFSRITNRFDEAAPMIKRERSVEFSALPADVAFRICAIRETFEESGVLLARPSGVSKQLVENSMSELGAAFIHNDVEEIKQWRERVNQEPSQFLEMCLQLDLVPEIWCLYEWANWLTPAHEAQNQRRFDTMFYICCIDHKPDVEQDFGEVVKSMWATPAALVKGYVEQKGGLGPPQVYELTRLLQYNSADNLLDAVSSPSRARVHQTYPVIATCQDYVLSLLPGDDLYPKEIDYVVRTPMQFDEPIEDLNRRYPGHNRMVMNLSTKVFTPSFTITPSTGHPGPRIDILHKMLTARARL